ncbi:MAG: histidine kinase dimerization/phospho-acceptor domain-containing protein [Bulleidia sp.]
MKKNDIRTNGFLKAAGVLLLMALCAIACLSGYLVLETSYFGNTDNYFETYESFNRVVDRGQSVLYEYIDTGDIEVDNSSANSLFFKVEEYDGEEFKVVHDSLDPDEDYIFSTELAYYAYPLEDSDSFEVYCHFYNSRQAMIDNGVWDGERAFYVTAKLRVPTSAKDPFYQEYMFFAALKPYEPHALSILITTMWVALGLLIFEITAAGHRKDEEGISLSWFDRIPFDLETVLVGLGVIFLFMGAISSINARDYVNTSYVGGMLLPLSCVELACLIAYFWLISLVVRIKSRTLFSNNVITFLICRLMDALVWLKDAVGGLVRPFRESPKWWLAAVSIGYGIGIIMQMGYLYRTGIMGLILLAVSMISGFVMLMCGSHGKVLLDAAQKLSAGDLDYRIEETKLDRMRGPFYQMGRSFNEIGNAMESAVSEKMKSERMKTELITNVSHDLKTPLTSIINYVDLLKKEHSEEQAAEYLEVLDRQSQRLKRLTEDVVEASKASTGNIQVNMGPIGIQEILDQAIAEYEDKINEADLHIIRTMSDEKLLAHADGRLLWRVVRNLLSNICKYALPGTRVYIDVLRRDNHICMVFKNTSRDELNISVDELKERFVRGDSSRHVEGSGLGLSIVESLMKVMGGECELSVDGDLFKVILYLNQVGEM